MTPKAYVATQAGLVAAATSLVRIDLPAFLAAIERSQVLLDPTLHRTAAELRRVQRLARAAMTLRGEVLAQVRQELGGAAEAAGLNDDELAELFGAREGVSTGAVVRPGIPPAAAPLGGRPGSEAPSGDPEAGT